METIPVPQPEINEYRIKVIATSNAFDTLVAVAAQRGMSIQTVNALNYLPKPELAQQFKDVCTAILNSIKVPDAQ